MWAQSHCFPLSKPLCRWCHVPASCGRGRDAGAWPSRAVSRGFSERRPGCQLGGSLAGGLEARTGVRVPCPASLPAGVSLASFTRRQGRSVHLGDKINGVTSCWRASPLHGETRGSVATGTNCPAGWMCPCRTWPRNPSHPSSAAGLVPV